MHSFLLAWASSLVAIVAAQNSTGAADSGYSVKTPPLDTPWTYKVGTNPWNEYPRPQRQRKQWQNLNGVWGYQNASSADELDDPPFDQTLEKPILVPSCIESGLSGVQELNAIYSWFSTSFTVPSNWTDRVLLNFGAVDYEATVFVNGEKAGFNRGGYFGFTIDITDYIQKTRNELLVFVHDPTDGGDYVIPLGKQALNPDHIFYRPCSGIWQQVWIETAPASHVTDLHVSGDMHGQINMTIETSGPAAGDASPFAEVWYLHQNSTKPLGSAKCNVNESCTFSVGNASLWSPESPTLYDLYITWNGDNVYSYTGFRTITKGVVNGVVRPTLNGKPIFQMGTLDQGFWPDGLYTPPSREAMVFDLHTLKSLGFNMVRKHIKIEPALFYRACDELGLLVIQDMPALRQNSRLPNADEQNEFERQLSLLIKQHRNYPSIGTWVIYNEGWGQITTPPYPEIALTDRVRSMDPTRLIDATTGWYDHGAGDYSDNHHYANPQCGTPFYSIQSSPYDPSRIGFQGEFGGLGHNVSIEHLWNAEPALSNINQTYEINESLAAWNWRGHQLLSELLAQTEQFACSGAVYTQTTDVEGEVNGLLTYDRRILRPDVTQWKADIEALYAAVAKRVANTTNPTPFHSAGPDGQSWWGDQSLAWMPNGYNNTGS